MAMVSVAQPNCEMDGKVCGGGLGSVRLLSLKLTELAKVLALIWSGFLMFQGEKEVEKSSGTWSCGW